MKISVYGIVSWILFMLLLKGCGTASKVVDNVTDAADDVSESVEETVEETEEKVETIKKRVNAAKSTISGQVNDLAKEADANIESYSIVVQNLIDSAVQYVPVDGDGQFSFDLDSGSFAMTILDDQSKVSGILNQSGFAGLFSQDSVLELGPISFGDDKIATVADSIFDLMAPDSTYLTKSKSLANLGAGAANAGGPSFDRDLDGVIDLFDVDIDNNGILNDQDVEDALLKLSQFGEAEKVVQDVELLMLLVTEYKMPKAFQMRQASLGMFVRPKPGITIDSVKVEGPGYLFHKDAEWRYRCNDCPGDNMPRITRNGVQVMGYLNWVEDEQTFFADVGDQGEQMSMAEMRPGDVVFFYIYSGGAMYRVIRTISWVFRNTPTLYAIHSQSEATADRKLLYDSTALAAYADRHDDVNPAVDTLSDLIFTVNKMRGRSAIDDLPVIGFNNYEIQFMHNGEVPENGEMRPWQIGAGGNITSTENQNLIKEIDEKHQLEIRIPAKWLHLNPKEVHGEIPEGYIPMGWKIDLGMYDRSGNKTVMQVQIDRKK